MNLNDNSNLEYISKNLIFIAIFVILATFNIFYFLLPDISVYKQHKTEWSSTNAIAKQVEKDYLYVKQHLDSIKSDSAKLTEKIRFRITENDIYALGGDVFHEVSVEKIASKVNNNIESVTYEIKGKVINPSAIMTFISALKDVPFLTNIQIPLKVEKIAEEGLFSFSILLESTNSLYEIHNLIKQDESERK